MKSNNDYKLQIFLMLLLIILFIFSLSFGTTIINIFSNDLTENEINIIYNLRLPRTVVAIMAGATLSASGRIMQVILRNDLADSSILGFQSGASLFAMLIILVFPDRIYSLPLFAFLGGFITFVAVLILSIKKSGTLNLILIGIAVNAIIGSIIGLLFILFSDNIQDTLSYSNGSLSNVSKGEMNNILMYSAIGIVLTILLKKRLLIFELDDVQMNDLGINVKKSRIIFAALSVFLSSISVSFIGIISFVGLIGPHIAKKISKSNDTLIVAMLVGGILVLLSDFIQRVLFIYYEISVGLIMSFIGGIFFICILISKEEYDKI